MSIPESMHDRGTQRDRAPYWFGAAYSFTCYTGSELEQVWNQMPKNLSIKNAPDQVVRRLRQRAERHHRSLQGELLAIIEEAVRSEQDLSPTELLAEVRRLGLNTSAESASIIRADRDRH